MINYITYPQKYKDKTPRLEVIKDLHTDSNRHHYYLCRCPKCGKPFKVLLNKLFDDKLHTCKHCSMKYDYAGMVIDGYTMLDPVYKEEQYGRNSVWKAMCNKCGKIIEVQAYQIYYRHLPKCRCITYKPSKSFLDQIL